MRAGARTTSAKMPGPVGRRVRDGVLRGLAASGVMAREVLATTAHRLPAGSLDGTPPGGTGVRASS